MANTLKFALLSLFFILASNSTFAQNTAEPAKTTENAKKEEDEFAKKKVETKLTEVIPTDSVAAAVLLKRAVAWIKVETPKYIKSSGTTTSNKAECSASFPVKPKELNPQVDYTGKITMKVVIECKDSKYRYTVSEIKHISKKGNTSGGSIDNLVPDCGSMAIDDLVWKKLRGEALTAAAKVVIDLKEGMNKIESVEKTEEW
jgi:hypothetical protein